MKAITTRMTHATLALLVAFCVANGPQSRPAAAPGEREITALIGQLASDDPAIRNHAQKALVEIGDPAKSLLQSALKSRDPEVAARAEVTLQLIDDPLAPTWVNIDAKDVPASTVIESLAKQAREPLLIYQDAAKRRVEDTKLTTHAVHEPFWAVLLQVCEAVDLRPDCYMRSPGGGWALREDAGTWDRHNTTVTGPFAVHVCAIARTARMNFANPTAVVREMNINGFCHAEKKVHAQAIQNLQVTRCEDENGKPIAAHLNYSFNNFATEDYGTFAIALEPGKSKSISVLEGDVEFVLETHRDRIEVNNLLQAANVQQTAGPIRMEIRDCRKTEERRWALRIRVHREGRDNLAWTQLLARLNNCPPRLEDSQERPLDNWGPISSKSEGETAEIEFPYANFVNYGRGIPTDPVRLVWEVPTRTQIVKAPFHFAQLPVPGVR